MLLPSKTFSSRWNTVSEQCVPANLLAWEWGYNICIMPSCCILDHMSYFVFVQVAEHSLHFTKTGDGFDLYKISYKFVLYSIMHHIISNLIGASEHTFHWKIILQLLVVNFLSVYGKQYPPCYYRNSWPVSIITSIVTKEWSGEGWLGAYLLTTCLTRAHTC